MDKNKPMPEEERTMINQGGLAVAALPATVGALFMLWCVRLPRHSVAALTLAEVARAPVKCDCCTDASDTRHALAGAWAASWVGFKPLPPHANTLKHTHRHTHRETDRQTDRHTHTHTHPLPSLPPSSFPHPYINLLALKMF